jgi:predicted metal-dependent peptidase
MQVDPAIHKQINNALNKIVLRLVFFTNLMLQLNYEPRAGGTAATDSKNVFWNPEWIKTLTHGATIGAMVHEGLHNALCHFSRQGDRVFSIWAEATDYEINHIILDFAHLGIELWDGALVNLEWKRLGYTAETMYPLIVKQREEEQANGGGKDGEPKDGECGKHGCQGIMQPVNAQGEPATPTEMEKIKVQWTQALEDATRQHLREHGTLPGTLANTIAKIKESKIDYRQVLHQFVTDICRADYSYQKPHKAYLQRGIYMPTLYSKEIGTLAIASDVSGSTYGKVYDAICGNMQALICDVKPALTYVMYVDTIVQKVVEFSAYDIPKFEYLGGGGTSFKPAFEYLEEHGIEPAALIYLTDMYGDFPDTEPSYPVLWIQVGGTEAVLPPFGQHLHVREADV